MNAGTVVAAESLANTGGDDPAIMFDTTGATASAGTAASAILIGTSGATLDTGSGHDVVIGLGNGVTTNSYTGATILTGTGDTGTVDGSTLILGPSAQATLAANYDTANNGVGGSLSLTGIDNGVSSYSGSLVLAGSGETGIVDGTALTLGSAAQAKLTANYDTVNNGVGGTLLLAGNSNGVNSYSGNVTLQGTSDYGTIDGTTLTLGAGARVGINANYDTVNNGASAAITLGGNDNTVYSSSGAVTLAGIANAGTINGTTLVLGTGAGGTLNANYDNITGGNAASFNLSGIYNAITLTNANDYLGLFTGSANNTVTATGATIGTQTGASFNLGGGSDVVGLGTDSYLGLLNGSGYGVTTYNSIINTAGNVGLNLSGGSDNAVLGGTGNYLGLLGSSNYQVTGVSSIIDTRAGTGLTLGGSFDSIGLGGTGNYLGLTGGNGFSVGAYGSTIATNGATSFNVTGNGLQLNLGASGNAVTAIGSSNAISTGPGDYVQVGGTGGSPDSVSGNSDVGGLFTPYGEGTGIEIQANSQATLASGSSLFGISSGDALLVNGSHDVLFGYPGASGDHTTFGTGSVGDALLASNAAITVRAGSNVSIVGNSDATTGTNATVQDTGINDSIQAPNSTIDFVGPNTGDVGGGAGSNGSDWSNSSGSVGDQSPVTGSTSYGDSNSSDDTGNDSPGSSDDDSPDTAVSGLARSGSSTPGLAIQSFLPFDHAAGEVGAAEAADAQVSALASGATGLSPFDGARWATKTITYSFAGASASGFSGALPASDQAIVQQAFGAWAKASGLTFQQAASPVSADIQIGWDKLDTSATGALGFTLSPQSAGVFQDSATIRLEDPAEDPLTAGSGGKPTYSDGDASLYQVTLHEIGHALGLADVSGSDSVMNFVFSPFGTSISAKDVSSIKELYALSAQSDLLPALPGPDALTPSFIGGLGLAEPHRIVGAVLAPETTSPRYHLFYFDKAPMTMGGS